jgi:hypothetical protein
MEHLVIDSGTRPSAVWAVHVTATGRPSPPTSVLLTCNQELVSHLRNTSEHTSHETAGHRTAST